MVRSTAPVDTIVTDCSSDWPALLDAYFGNEAYTADFQVRIPVFRYV